MNSSHILTDFGVHPDMQLQGQPMSGTKNPWPNGENDVVLDAFVSILKSPLLDARSGRWWPITKKSSKLKIETLPPPPPPLY
jgi:hypothetical protein